MFYLNLISYYFLFIFYFQENLVSHIAKISETVAQVIADLTQSSISSNLNANTDLIEKLIECYTVTAKCELFQAMFKPDFVKNLDLSSPLAQYVGVDRSTVPHTLFTYRLLTYLTNEPLEGQYSVQNCTAPENQTVFKYIYVNGENVPEWWNGTKEQCDKSLECGYCYNTTAKLTTAVSPGMNFY